MVGPGCRDKVRPNSNSAAGYLVYCGDQVIQGSGQQVYIFSEAGQGVLET